MEMCWCHCLKILRTLVPCYLFIYFRKERVRSPIIKMTISDRDERIVATREWVHRASHLKLSLLWFDGCSRIERLHYGTWFETLKSCYILTRTRSCSTNIFHYSSGSRRDSEKGSGDRKRELPRDPNDLRYNLSRKRQGVVDARCTCAAVLVPSSYVTMILCSSYEHVIRFLSILSIQCIFAGFYL